MFGCLLVICMTGETIVNFHTSIHIKLETRTPPSPTMTGDRILIPVEAFLMFARVVVGETYDGRNSDLFSFNFQYVIRVTGRVVVGKTYDGSDEVCFPLGFENNLKSKPG